MARNLYKWATCYLSGSKESMGVTDLVENYEKLAKFGVMIMEENVEQEMMDYWNMLKGCNDGYKREKEGAEIEEFKKVYGFHPNEIEKKREYLVKDFFDNYGEYPENDEEINNFVESDEFADMLRLDWKGT